MKTIVLAGGGTAGHIMPHVALFKYLETYFDKICYVGTGGTIENTLIKPLNIPMFTISAPRFLRKLTLENLSIPIKMHKAVNESVKILEKVGATCVFSKGGYSALPVCIAAKKLKIPVICHESDLSMGLANKITSLFAKNLLTTFPETAVKYHGTFCGPPINDNFINTTREEGRKSLNISTSKPILLITGGSQGSRAINSAVFENIGRLTRRFFVIHLTGKGNKCPYKSVNDYLPMEFGNMAMCVAAADLCLSRGGSNTLFELLYAKKPSLIIPLKKGSRGDQIKNAQYFAERGAILQRDEDEFLLAPVKFIDELFDKKDRLIKNIEDLKIKNGTKNIFDCILKTVEKYKR